MKLHVFNPEHDIALASGLTNFTAPHAGRQLRADVGFLPALWAMPGDYVLVDHVEAAQKSYARLRSKVGARGVTFVDDGQLERLPVDGVEAWGWDAALVAMLRRKGVRQELLPTREQTDRIRLLSHRRTSARLLPLLQTEGTVGEAFECSSLDEVRQLLRERGRVVVKAPWSSSGRGVRFLSADDLTPSTLNWLNNVVQRQGSVMVEPQYNKVKDFGMEYEATADGIRYVGLSLFQTQNGAYTGNILATERTKREMISRYIPGDLLDYIQERIMAYVDLGDYQGPFGVDMMLTAGSSHCLLHPCVEINLRRTMGHVALALAPTDDDVRRVMRIEYTNYYKIKINKL